MNTEPERVLVAFATLFLIVTITATSLRCYVRIVMVKSFGADDALAVFAMVSVSKSKRISYPAIFD